MQVLDQQLASMCEGVQSDLPYPTKCEEVVHSKQNNVQNMLVVVITFHSLSLLLYHCFWVLQSYTYKDLVPSFIDNQFQK